MAAQGSDVLTALTPAATAPLQAWLSWLEAGRGEQIDLGLERCAEVAARLGLGRPAPVVVTVAGTNGKGSSVALLSTIWRVAGYRVGAYTSPHLLRYNERIRIDGVAVDDARITAAFARIEAHYFINRGFFSRDDQLLRGARHIRHIPGVIVQGRYDVVCPMRSAWDLHRAWPEAELVVVPDAGHSMSEDGIRAALIAHTHKLA